MDINTGSEPFDAYYFEHGCGRPYKRDKGWLDFFDSIAAQIVKDIQPESVLDTGCAMGFLVEQLRKRDVEAFGVDISEYAIQNVHSSIKSYCWQGTIAEPFPREYDLIVCIEVLEHIPSDQTQKVIENICLHRDDVLFSSTHFDCREVTHYNIRLPEEWAELFAQHSFFRDVDYDASYINPWAFRVVRSSPPIHRVVRDYERRFSILWKENVDLRALAGDLRGELSVADTRNRELEGTEPSRIKDLVEQVKDSQIRLKEAQIRERVVNEELNEARLKMASLEAGKNDGDRRLRDLNDQLEEMEKKLQVVELILAEKDDQLQAVYRTLSWRMMHPFRLIRKIIAPQGSTRDRWLSTFYRRLGIR